MAISQQESFSHTCAVCGQTFDADQWTLIDVQERPDLRDALLDGQLNTFSCPACAAPLQPSGPLLLHDAHARRVYFAVPYDEEEHRWRNQAQELLYSLVGALPEDARLPYLGDVQVEWGLDGVQRALTRKGRRGSAAARQATPPQGAAATPQVAPVVSVDLLERVQQLLAVDSADEFTALVREHSELLGSAADTLLGSLAAEARNVAEHEAAAAIQQVRSMLRGMRSTVEQEPTDEPHALPETVPIPDLPIMSDAISDAAYQAFLSVAAPADLVDALRDHPALLEPWAEGVLTARAELALDLGNERLAALIGEHCDFLAPIRAELTAEPVLRHAIHTLLEAKAEEEMAQVLAEYPVLLTELAQVAFAKLADQAQATGDATQATYVRQCRATLRQVRSGMDTI